MKDKKIVFITSNENKLREVREILRGFEVVSKSIPFIEIQGRSFEDVVFHKLSQVIGLCEEEIIVVEDSGIVIDALSESYEFPGIYSKPFLDALNLEGVLDIMKNKPNRGAKMVCCVGVFNRSLSEIKVFRGEVRGVICDRIRGSKGFGYDPIFIPQGYNVTFGEDPKIKNILSHRKLAFEKLKDYLLSL